MMMSYLNLPSFKLSGLFLGLIVLMSACTKKDFHVSDQTKQSLQNIVDNGVLLNSISEKGGDYIFHFENGDVEISKSEIKNIVPVSEIWKTTITFSDGSAMSIPSKGGSLSFIIKDVTLNPSGYNPLAALVEVELPTFGRVKVTVHGKNGTVGTITHLCSSQTPHQSVPVFGLYADYENKVDLAFTDKDGRERGTTQITIRTGPLVVQDLPEIQVTKALYDRMEPGINFVNYPGASMVDVSMPYMVDDEGEVRWILLLKASPDLGKVSISTGLFRTPKGTLIAGDQQLQRIVEFDMFGNLLRQWDLQHLGYTFHHDISIAANGNFLITVTKPGAKLSNGQPRVMDHIIELDTASGSLVKEWDLANIVDSSRYLKPDGITPPAFSQSPNNWAHNNAVSEIGNDLLASMRYQGIISFSHSGALQWIISPHKYWSEKYKPYLLSPVDENGNLITDSDVINGDASTDAFDWSWGPHDPVTLSNDRILVFDNGYNRSWKPNALTVNNNYSRVVEYKIDRVKMTVQQVWSYGKERGPQCFSQALSGVELLPNTGNILFCPGMGVPTQKGAGGRVIEIDPLTKEVVFEMEISTSSNTAFHRVTRMSLYPDSL